MAFNQADLVYIGVWYDDKIVWRYDRTDETSSTVFSSSYAISDMTAAQKVRDGEWAYISCSDGDFLAFIRKDVTSQPPPVGAYRYLQFSKFVKLGEVINFGSIY